MNAESFLQSFSAALDAVAEREFDFSRAGDLFPTARALSVAQRLQVVKDFEFNRPEFLRRNLALLPAFDVSAEVRRIDQSMERLAFDLVEEETTRSKLINLAKEKLLCMRADDPYVEVRDQLNADLLSSDMDRKVRALFHVKIKSNEWADLIRSELAATTGTRHEFRKSQFTLTLDLLQRSKSDLVGECFVLTMLWALHYADGIPTRDLMISGLSGLNRAIEMFDSKRGFAFPKYANWWIRQALLRAAIELRGWKMGDLQALSDMKKLVGKERWEQWSHAPNPEDVSSLGLSDEQITNAIERGRDTNIYPIHIGGEHLTPECAGVQREWVTLSDNVTTDTNPVWWV